MNVNKRIVETINKSSAQKKIKEFLIDIIDYENGSNAHYTKDYERMLDKHVEGKHE